MRAKHRFMAVIMVFFISLVGGSKQSWAAEYHFTAEVTTVLSGTSSLWASLFTVGMEISGTIRWDETLAGESMNPGGTVHAFYHPIPSDGYGIWVDLPGMPIVPDPDAAHEIEHSQWGSLDFYTRANWTPIFVQPIGVEARLVEEDEVTDSSLIPEPFVIYSELAYSGIIIRADTSIENGCGGIGNCATGAKITSFTRVEESAPVPALGPRALAGLALSLLALATLMIGRRVRTGT